MAFTPATGDTSIGKQKASKTISPPPGVPAFTRKTAVSGKLGKTALTFKSPVPQPEGTAPIEKASTKGPNIRGRQGPFGKDSIGNAITGAAELLSPLIADAFSGPANIPGASGAQLSHNFPAPPSIPGAQGQQFGFGPAQSFATPAPSAIPFNTSEGGFIRKRT